VTEGSPEPAAAAPAAPPPAAAGAPPSPVGRAELDRLLSGTAAVLPEGALEARLAEARRAGRPLRVKLGLDPSTPDLTLGHAVVLRKLRQFQDTGHLAVLIVGDFTGMVGDPTDRNATRPALTAEQARDNAGTYLDQVLRILDPARVEVRRNSEWLAGLTMTEVVREARELTVARLLERDDFATRFAQGRPISLVEFLYPLLQGYDSVAVRADVELGGSDQTYNLLVGRDLQRAHGQPPQVVVTVPLLEGLDGVQKMSKSLGNYVGISEPAADQYGKLMSIPDGVVGRYLRLATDLPPDDVDRLAAQAAAGGPPAAAAKRRLAREVVTLYHGVPAADRAEERFDSVFRRHEAAGDAPARPLPPGDPVHLPALLVTAGLAGSNSEARRSLRDGGVRLDGLPLPPGPLDLARGDLAGRVLSVGRRRSVRLVDAPAGPAATGGDPTTDAV
jgi:tyrosyl-tRNA synthetase